LGFLDEAQAPAVAGEAGGQPDRERARRPERVQPAWLLAEFTQAVLAPGEVRALLGGGGEHVLAYFFRARGEGMALVQRLRGDFARMVHAHEPGGVLARGLVEFGRRHCGGRVRASGRLAIRRRTRERAV